MLNASIELIFPCHSLLFLQESRPRSLRRQKRKGQSMFLYATLYTFLSPRVIYNTFTCIIFDLLLEALDFAKQTKKLSSCIAHRLVTDFIRTNYLLGNLEKLVYTLSLSVSFNAQHHCETVCHAVTYQRIYAHVKS